MVLEPLGKQFLAADMNERKLMLREQLKKHWLFSYFVRLLHGQEDQSLTKEVVLEHLAMLLPNEKPERQFMAMVNGAASPSCSAITRTRTASISMRNGKP